MKDPLERTKVVIRHLPPSLPHSDLFHHIHDRFAGRYNSCYYRPGKTSQKEQRYARAYIDFTIPEDVFEFAEFFDGHVFVNEKGAQYKAVVEYAPSQRVPRSSSKKDGREGTIYKDPDYLEFLKLIAKPAEHLPSAEIQLERKEAEQSGVAKDTPIVTPLMEFVRQKRAVESGTQGSSVPRKVKRGVAASSRKHESNSMKRGMEKKKYILKDSGKNTNRRDKSNFILVPRREDQSATSSGIGISDVGTADSGKKKILLLKGKGRDVSHIADGMLQFQSATSSGNSPANATKQNQRREAGGSMIRSILLNNDARHGQSSSVAQSHQKIQILNSDNGKRPPRPINSRSGSNDMSSNDPNPSGSEGDGKRAMENKFNKKEHHGLGNASEKQEKRIRNKDRPDRGVWAPRGRSDASVSQLDESSVSQSTHLLSDSVEAYRGEMKDDVHGSRTGDVTTTVSGRSSSVENGSVRHVGRRGAVHIMKDDGSLNPNEGKPSRRGVAGGHEKQVWVQKSSSGS
ncbi:regulator of nonsense transcripts UPF3-like isoform X1 [Cucurbita moschata]|uniref:Regulator of nonsense transcripts UPF3-like isoform X1 n=1 Tax=Cucurbita moschata TaxID=3662 RepID=A0A6J1GA31_CUCMO|nr:regulator of nonsense transcripts UPF3-like isoform X1 [Cucurbita moschata]